MDQEMKSEKKPMIPKKLINVINSNKQSHINVTNSNNLSGANSHNKTSDRTLIKLLNKDSMSQVQPMIEDNLKSYDSIKETRTSIIRR